MFQDIEKRGLVLLGCGKMGSAMLAGWLDRGLSPKSVWVLDPNPSDWVQGLDINLNVGVPEAPAIVLVAVKPQMMGEALPVLAALGDGDTIFLSVAAGTFLYHSAANGVIDKHGLAVSGTRSKSDDKGERIVRAGYFGQFQRNRNDFR